MFLLTLGIKFGILFHFCNCSCTFPSLWDSGWTDSVFGDLTLNSASGTLTGWGITSYRSSLTSWTCVAEDSTNNYLLFLADQRIDLFSSLNNGFRCIKWKKITDYSYYYYARSNIEMNAEQSRIHVEPYISGVTTWDTATYCNPTSGPGPEEYHILIKQGYESSVKQWCPNPIIASLSYEHNDGSTTTCGVNSDFSTCPTWTTISIDYAQCSTTQAFTQEGQVYCVNSIRDGDTFYTVTYNPGIVDNTNYYKFTCYAIRGNSSTVYASDNPSICAVSQTPTSKTTEGGTLVMTPKTSCYGNCNFPATWDGAWYDSGWGDIIMSRYDSSIIAGWETTVNGKQLTTWTCQSQDTTNNLMLFKADEFVEINEVKYNIFRCIRWTKLTNSSYIYYIENDIDALASNQRIYKEIHDPAVNSWSTTTLCKPTSGPSVEEYHTLVQKDYVEDAKQWCPIPLLANFTYVHNDGSATTCSSSSDLSVCPNWTTLSFDYSKCSTIQAFSQEGVAHCVHTVKNSDTYFTTVINPGVVDGTTYHRFTCIAFTSDNNGVLTVSDSKGMCQSGQTPTTKTVDGSGVLILTPYVSCHGSCTLPADWNSTWHDSDMGQITFDQTNSKITSGWSVTAYGTTISKWTCQTENTTSNYMLFKSDDTIEESGIKYNLFRCIEWRNVTQYSYRYYVLNDLESLAGNVRVKIEQYDPTVNNWLLELYCNPSSGPGLEEYNVLVKQGHEADVKQWCPIPLRGTFTYLHNDGTSHTCSAATSSSGLSLCPSWTTLIFDYTLCPTTQAFSQEGIVHCIDTVESGGIYFTSLLNPGNVDGVNYHRFTCLAFNTSGSLLYASDSKGSCAQNQSPKSKSSDGSGTLILTKQSSCYGSCTMPMGWNNTWYDSGMTDITFSETGVQGWDISAYGDTVTSWTCQNSQDNLLLFKADVEVYKEVSPLNMFRCIEITKITDYSYMYYVLAENSSSAGNKRIFFETHDPEVTSWRIPTYCNTSYMPAPEEYHMLIKKGFESEAKQWCPPLLRGNFTYDHFDGNATTCSTSSGLSVCPTWTTMSFDYSKCPTEQAFSMEGVTYCIQTILSGSTYFTSVLNPGFIDGINYFRFTCYAVTGNGTTIYASDSEGMCERGQVSTTKQSDGSGTLAITATESTCTFPDTWDSLWYDSNFGDIMLNNETSSVTSGWTVSTHNATLTSWTCVSEDKSNKIFLFLSNEYVVTSDKRQNVFMCIKWTKITDYSYIYYVLNDIDVESSNRLLFEDNDPTVTSWPTSVYCNPSSPPVSEEFHMLVKSGMETQVKQWCPHPLRGSFAYIHNNLGVDACVSGSDLNVCPEWTTMTFDYAQCPKVQAFSQEGIVDCVYSLNNGSMTYTMVLNPGVVDGVTYHRFTCFVIEGETKSTVYMSDSAGSCLPGQTPTAKASDGTGTLTLTSKATCTGSCAFPDYWNATWYDSYHGDITMDAIESTISGWDYTISGITVSSWTCQTNTTQDNMLLFMADKQIEVGGIVYNIFKCIKLRRLTDYSYSYYIFNDLESTAGDKRLLIDPYDPSVTSWSTTSFCNPSSPPSNEEFHMLIKKGYENAVKQWCPVPLIGSFTYTHNSGSLITCGLNSDLSVCSDWTVMIFDYNKCSTIQTFSQEGIVNCVHTVKNGSIYYTSVLNPGTVDQISTHRFTCLSFTLSGSLVLMSDSAGSCEKAQIPSSKQTDGSGLISLTQSVSCYGNCSFPDEWDGTWMDSGYGNVIMDRSKYRITSGWAITVDNTSLTSWTCHSENTSMGSGLLLFKADELVENATNRYNVFRCIKWHVISNYSYYYYIMEDTNPLANNERVRIELHDPSVFSWDVNIYCNPSTVPSSEEYHVFVKKGYETEVKDWCPYPLRGLHTYTHTKGSTTTCTTSSNLNVCPDWSTMTFNYSMCSTTQAFSAEGVVYCVNTVIKGSTYYTTVLNPGIVDNITYHRFSCYAMTWSSTSIHMSSSAGSCEAGQSPTVEEPDSGGLLSLITTTYCHGTCTLPNLWDGTWYDSGNGDIILDHSTSRVTSGWQIQAYNSYVTSWTCVTDDVNSNFLLFLGDQSVDLFGNPQNAFKCIKWKKLTDYSYSFYVRANIELNAGSKRIFMQQRDNSVTSWSTNDYCNPSNGPGVEEYHMLVKQGYENLVKQWCPIPLLGKFSYIHNDGSTTSCGSGSVLDVCEEWTTMTFNYTQCNTKQAFSGEGTVYCVNTVTSGDTFYTTVFNPGTVDNSINYRFSCFAISTSNNVVYISDSAGSCAQGQSSTVKAVDGSGTLELTPYNGSCTFPSTWNATWYDSGMGDIEMEQSKHSITAGWIISAFGINVTSWTCLSDNTSNSVMLFKADVNPEVAGVQHNVFRCIKWTRLTNYSFAYYVYNDVNANASNERVLIEEVNPATISFDIAKYCSPNSPPGQEEYHMMIKKDYHTEVRQWCPIPIIGRYSYTHTDGAATSCRSGSEMTTCADWKTLMFDYNKCPKEQAFSAEGSVTCVHTIAVGTSYFTSVYNPGVIDFTHHRFTCLAFTEDGNTIQISDSAGSCNAGQTPNVRESDGSGTLTMTAYSTCYGDCDFPSTWNSSWYDSNFGDIEIDIDKHRVESGWTINVYGHDITSWTCHTEDTNDNYLLFKGDQFVHIGGDKYNVFRCIKWTKITDFSYRYYIYNDPESNADGNRVFVEHHDPNIIFWNISSYCTPSNPPSTEEYHVMVKKGYESDVRRWCPIPIIGTFSYVYNDGSTDKCTGSSELSLCPSWTTLQFNYSKCSDIQVFSQEGMAYCVDTVTIGTTYYTTVLNPGNVDYNSYFRFTCLAIQKSGSSIVISDSKGSCRPGQSPSTKQTDGSGTLLLTSTENTLTAIVCPLCVVYKSHGNCTFPSEWDATWYDSRGGDITMGLTPHDISSGWSFNVFNTNVTSFTCQSQETAAENYYLFKSDELVEHSNKLYNVFVCMKWTRITDYSYYYYMWQDINADAAGERVFIEEQNPYISQWNITQYCASANPPPSEQFHVLVKQGYDTNVKQWCPIPLLGTFYYTHDNGVNQTCGNGSVWEVCPSWTTITFNYTQCPTKQAFSDEGTVFCVFTQLIGSTYYASVLNPGSVDNSNYHRFTCLAVSSDSNSDDVFISDSIGSCEAGQSSTSRQVDGSGILTLTPYSLCQGSCIFPLQWESTWYDSGMGQIEIVAPSKSITSGWNINAFGQVVTSWTCQAGDTINNLLLFKSDDTVLTGGVRYNVFRCIKWREITPYSYFYYTQHDVQANAQGERVFLEVYDASVTSWDTSVYCNPSAGPPVEEFHTLVKKGFEPQVTQPCPTPLLGTFTYTHDDGTTETCGTNSQLQLCPSWNSMTFDYTKCNTEQAFSLEGAASCVMTLYDNNTSYTSVLNTGDVSSSSHDRFTCYSMNRNASFVYMSDSRGSCMERQQPTIKQTDGSGTLILTPIEYCHDSGSCLFPSDWNGEWFDSDLGEISMSSLMKSVVSGWSILIGNNTIASWSCVSSFENYILFKSDQLLDQNNTFYNVFRCIEWTKITQYSYYYYVRANEQDIANKARLTLEVYDAAVRSWDTATYCNPSHGPSKGEYHVIYKIGFENEAKQWCPTPLLGKFTYTHNNGGTLTCTGYSDLDVCTNRTTLTFNYTLCNTPQVFSEEGTVYCINTVQDGSTYYTTILNPGSLLNPFYTRITCLVITTEGSYVYASDSRGSCDNEQNSTAKQIDGSGFLTLSSYVTCEFTTGNIDESKPETSSASTAAIVGALVGLLVLIAIIAGILILCKKLKEKSMQKKTSPSEYSTGKKLPIPSTPPALTIEVTDKKKHTALPPLYPAMDVKPIHKDTEIPDSSEKPEKPKQHKHKKKKKHKQKSPRKDKDRTENPRKAETPDIIRGTSSHYVDDFGKDMSDNDLYSATPRTLPSLGHSGTAATNVMIDKALSRVIDD